MVKLLQVLFPLYGEQLLFGVVALFAAGHYVALGAFAAARYGHNVIHGQFFRQGRSAAVMADTFRQAPFPPLGIAQYSGFAALPFEVFLAQIIGKGVYGLLVFHN